MDITQLPEYAEVAYMFTPDFFLAELAVVFGAFGFGGIIISAIRDRKNKKRRLNKDVG